MVDITIVFMGVISWLINQRSHHWFSPSKVLEIAPTELSDDLQWAADGAWVMRRGRTWLFFSEIFRGFSWDFHGFWDFPGFSWDFSMDFIDLNGCSCGVLRGF